MRILIDESLPRHLKRMLSEHQASTVEELGWAGIRNSELLAKVESQFDALLTADKNLRYQQNLTGMHLAIVVFPSNRLQIMRGLREGLRDAMSKVQPGEVIEL